MRAWLQHHGLSLAQTLARLARSPFATTLNVLAIGVAIALPFGVYCMLSNLESFSRNASVDPQLSVFLAKDAAKADIAAVEARLKSAGGVSGVRFVSRDAALVELNRAAGMEEVIASLPQNPLPDAFVVTLSASDPALADRLELQFKSLPKVAYVQADSAWVRRLDALLRLGRTAVVLLSAQLAHLYGSDIRLRLPNSNEMISALAAAVALGWLGAYLSVSRHLLEADRN